MNWLHVGDRAHIKKCDEHRKYGSCGCKKRKKQLNPCDRLEAIRQSCDALDRGEEPAVSVEEIKKWAGWQICHTARSSGTCNHRGCGIGQQTIDFVDDHLRFLKRKKAA